MRQHPPRADPFPAICGARIAHLIETDGPGGAERMLGQLAAEFQAHGCPAVAFLPEGGEGWLGSELAAAGVIVERMRLKRPFSPQFAHALAAAFHKHEIDLAHSHEFTMAFYGAWAARRAGIPHVITMHGGRYYAARWRRRLALRAAVALSGGLVAVSQQLADQLGRDLRLRPARIVTIPNGVRYEPASRSTLRAELALTPGDRLLLAVGNLYPVKGHRHLIEAAALLSSAHPTAHVAIAGRGELAAALVHLAGELGLGTRLHLLGLRSDVPNLLAGADVFVLPSISEGLPVALLEAMFAGCPIVASAVGEVPIALAHGEAGVLVEPGVVPALAAAVDRLLSDPLEARALGERARARAIANYDARRMVERYAGLYAKLLDRRPPARV